MTPWHHYSVTKGATETFKFYNIKVQLIGNKRGTGLLMVVGSVLVCLYANYTWAQQWKDDSYCVTFSIIIAATLIWLVRVRTRGHFHFHFRRSTNKCSLATIMNHPRFFLLRSLNWHFITIFCQVFNVTLTSYLFLWGCSCIVITVLLNVYVNGLDVRYCSCWTGCSILKLTFSVEGASPLPISNLLML